MGEVHTEKYISGQQVCFAHQSTTSWGVIVCVCQTTVSPFHKVSLKIGQVFHASDLPLKLGSIALVTFVNNTFSAIIGLCCAGKVVNFSHTLQSLIHEPAVTSIFS